MTLQPARRFVAGGQAPDFPPPPPGWADFETVMELALEKAREAAAARETPVGAVVLSPAGELLGAAGNAPITRHDPTAHAEILALRQAAARIGNYRHPGQLLAVTLEPPVMCLGAVNHARSGLLVYGAGDPRTGAIAGVVPGPDLPFFNHRVDGVSGVLEAVCGDLLRDFFRKRRQRTQGVGSE